MSPKNVADYVYEMAIQAIGLATPPGGASSETASTPPPPEATESNGATPPGPISNSAASPDTSASPGPTTQGNAILSLQTATGVSPSPGLKASFTPSSSSSSSSSPSQVSSPLPLPATPKPPSPASYLRSARSALRDSILRNPSLKQPNGVLLPQWRYRLAALESDERGALTGGSKECPPRANVKWKTAEDMEEDRLEKKEILGGSGLRFEVGGCKVGGGKDEMGKRRVGGEKKEGVWWVAKGEDMDMEDQGEDVLEPVDEEGDQGMGDQGMGDQKMYDADEVLPGEWHSDE